MTRRRRRIVFLTSGLVVLGLAVALVLTALQDTLVFFYSPSKLVTEHVEPGRSLRLGGLVLEGSVKRGENADVSFFITDLVNQVEVRYTGILPDLFREGQGVVAEGQLNEGGIFVARQVLAKHDENYMPKEVADALRDSGHWQEEEAAP